MCSKMANLFVRTVFPVRNFHLHSHLRNGTFYKQKTSVLIKEQNSNALKHSWFSRKWWEELWNFGKFFSYYTQAIGNGVGAAAARTDTIISCSRYMLHTTGSWASVESGQWDRIRVHACSQPYQMILESYTILYIGIGL